MKTAILILLVAAKMYPHSSLKFESSNSFTINVNSNMAISASIGENIISPINPSPKNKNAVYEKILNRIFYTGVNANETSLSQNKYTVNFNIVNSYKRQIIEKLYFQESGSKLRLVKSETLVIINEKF